jgi:hypothetical protein
MLHHEPPPLPPLRRVQTKLRYVVYAAATVFVTGWCYRLHPALGLTATFLAKHILVAILAAALRLPIREIKS